MTVIELLSTLRGSNIQLWLDGDRLRYHAPQGAMTSQLLSQIAEKKTEIIEILQKNQGKPPQITAQVHRESHFPLSFTQQRLWFLEQLIRDPSVYHICGGITLRGPLKVDRLEQCLNEIIQRHESLRTSINVVNEQPRQVIHSEVTLTLKHLNLQQIPQPQQPEAITLLLTEEAQKPFNLANAPLLKATLLHLAKFEYILVLTLHHLVFDAWSTAILVKELKALYEAKYNGNPASLPKLPLQYKDFAVWQQKWLQGDVLNRQLSYWKQTLQGQLPYLQLPTDYPPSSSSSFEGDSQSFLLSQPLSNALKTFSQQQGVTLFMTLLAAFKTLLYRYTRQEDLLVGTATAGRSQPELEPLIGCFVNTLVLRTQLSGDLSFVSLLAKVREVALAAYAHQDLPFEKLVEELQPERNLSHSPLFQVGFVFYNVPNTELKLPGLSLRSFSVETKRAKLDLTLSLKETEEGLSSRWEYRTNLFKATTITRMFGHFQTLLTAIVNNPQQSLDELPLLTQAESQQLIQDWNQTQKDYPDDVCIHQLFEGQVNRNPEAIALTFNDRLMTYQQLNIQANQLAHYLRSLGVKPGDHIGMALERSPLMMIALLGILKTGGVYVPLDPTYPQERLAFMVEDANLPIILTETSLNRWQTSEKITIICLDQNQQEVEQYSQINPNLKIKAHHPAYIIYTSGSTGLPKGVLVAHRGLCNLALAQIETFAVQEDSRVLQFASMSFDASISEIFMALVRGATLCLVSRDILSNPVKLWQHLREQSITTITLPPSMLAMLPEEELPALQTLIVAGEACSADLVARWSHRCRFFNAYGPTETTVCATIAECTHSQVQPSIGRPIANTQVYILDPYLQPVPIGVPGELYIGGIGLAQGYLNQPDLTAQQFLPNPFFNGSTSEKLYKTGDLARYHQDGSIEFLGRIDHQVKIRGFRIELGEIETRLGQYPEVQHCVVIADETPIGRQLVAYIVPQDGLDLEGQKLKDYLKGYLPNYMIPSWIMTLDTLPLTPNGKVDRKRLPKPDYNRHSSANMLITSRDSIELKLVQIWEEVLKIHPIGVTDNFFDVGGHSLLALRLIALIEQQFQIELPLSILFENGTIEAMATILRAQSAVASWSPLVTIQSSGSQTPLFLAHPIGGNALGYIALGRYLSSNQPLYALQAPGMDGQKSPYTSIPDLASYYIEAVKTIQPCGPYLLGGHSFGGLVALEMAQQLHKQGQAIALLVIMDTPAPIHGQVVESIDDAKWLVKRAQVLERFFGIHLEVDYTELQQLNSAAQYSYFLAKLRQGNLIPPDAGEQMICSLLAVQKASHQALIEYIPQIYPGKITLLRAARPLVEDSDGVFSQSFRQPDLGWSELTPEPVDVYDVPGDHITMLAEPYVQELANQLKLIIT
ncbi:MAG: amino acid adenylation domain-containing protein [Crocosphaera sp.]|nr:amino acid adenylation domain-containing protein [Crocosphaera sp.]